MSSASLTQRLQLLADTYKQTLNLIAELQRFPNGALFAEDPEEKRLEITNDIHQTLKEQEDTLELIRQEIDDDSQGQSRRRSSSEEEEERELHVGRLARLTEDIKNARSAFRRAQLQAKRNADSAKRREREELFAGRAADTPAPRYKGQEKLTQDELALNAAEDVTRSLRRAHDLLTSNLQQSQFAQQTLEESSEALRGLGEKYSGTTDLLKNSKGLVSQLMRSQKSDTWFLISSWYIMAVTIAWLIFRRLLYGPLWWLVYQPLRLIWWSTLASLGAIGFRGTAVSGDVVSSVNSIGSERIPTRQGVVHMPLPAKGGGWGQPAHPAPAPTPNSETPDLISQVERIIEESASTAFGSEDPATETPRNTKKRMMEAERKPSYIRDEL